jgi:hypothetical protein
VRLGLESRLYVLIGMWRADGIAVGPAEADSGSPTIRELKELNVEDLMAHDWAIEYGDPGPARWEIRRSVHGKLAWRY